MQLALGSSGNKTEQTIEDETARLRRFIERAKPTWILESHTAERSEPPQVHKSTCKNRTEQSNAPKRSNLSLTQRGVPMVVCKALWSLGVKDGLLGTLNTLPALS